MYVSVLTSPIGLITALAYSDKKRKFSQNAKATRTFLGFVVFVLWFIVVLMASETIASTFLKNQGWVLIVLLAPLISSLSTEFVMRNDQQIT